MDRGYWKSFLESVHDFSPSTSNLFGIFNHFLTILASFILWHAFKLRSPVFNGYGRRVEGSNVWDVGPFGTVAD